MAVTLTTLNLGSLIGAAAVEPAGTGTTRLYAPASQPTGKSAIVNCIRLTNTAAAGSPAAVVQVYYLKSSGIAGDAVRILPRDVAISPGVTLALDDELTLGPGESIHAFKQTNDPNVDFVVTGVERDA